MKAESRERLRVAQGALGALAGVHSENVGLVCVIKETVEHIAKVLDDERMKESEEEQCKE